MLAAFSNEEQEEHEGETIEFLVTVNDNNKYVFQDVGMSEDAGVPQYVGMEGMSTTPAATPVLDFVPGNTYDSIRPILKLYSPVNSVSS